MKGRFKTILSLTLAVVMLICALPYTVSATQQANNILLLGDSDLNGKVNIRDATNIQKHLLEYVTISGDALITADVNSDGKLTIRDATFIQKYIIDKPIIYPVNEPIVLPTQPSTNETDLTQPASSEPSTQGTTTPSEPADEAVWQKSSIAYEIFVRSFYDSDGDGVGDFRGVAEKADYLKSLNVGVVWLMPINKADTYHGYDIVDYYATNEDYGTIDDFEYMLDVLHENNIKVIMDFVANHSSSNNEWFKQALADKNSKYRDYYQISESKKTGTGWRYNSQYDLYYYGGFDKIMPDLNYYNKEVWTEMKNAAKFWLDIGVDGFRLDASKHIEDNDNALTHSWWQEFESYVKSINEDTFVVGENWSSLNEMAQYFADMDSSFDFPMSGDILNMAGGTDVNIIANANKANKLYKQAAATTPDINKYTIMTPFIANHDMTRTMTQLGNSQEKAKLAAAIEFTLMGMPFVYYGEEIGMMSNNSDPNRREPMDWYTSATGTGMCKIDRSLWGTTEKFTKANDGISVEEQKNDLNSLYNYYKTLMQIRTDYPIFYEGEYFEAGYNDNLYSYMISEDKTEYSMFIAHNIGSTDMTFTAKYDMFDKLNGKSYSAGDTVTVKAYQSVIATTQKVENTEKEQTYTIKLNVTLPQNTPENDDIYVAGMFDTSVWQANDENYKLTRTSATTAEITIKTLGSKGSLFQYKFTRGSWSNCECAADGSEIIGASGGKNHEYYFTQDINPTIDVTVAAWTDLYK